MRYAVERYRLDVETAEQRGLWLDEEAGNRAIDFFGTCLTHTAGEYAGEPFELRLFQKFIVWNLYTWKCLSAEGTERRRFRKAFVSLGRGNGKSPLAAGVGNYTTWMDLPLVPRAQCYTFATKEKQAKIVWEEAKCQIERSASAKLRKSIQRLTKNMHNLSTGAKMEPLGSDSNSSDGWIIHCAIIDELHAWQERHRGLHSKINTALKGNQPICFTVTTAGDENSDIWMEEYDWAKLVVTPDSGVEADDLFVFIAEVDRDKPCPSCGGRGCDGCENSGVVEVDVLDEAVWPQANPMLCEPRSPVKLDDLRSLANEARTRKEKLQEFKRYKANQMVMSIYKLITPELWARGNRELPDLTGQPCWLGMDWGWKDDIAALVAAFRLEDEYALRCWAWIPRDGKRDLSKQPWADWIERGIVEVTDGSMTDPRAIYRVMEEEILPIYSVQTVAFDPHATMEFGVKCQEDWGFNEKRVFHFTQCTKKYNEPMREFLRVLGEGKVYHGGNPLLAWCAGHLTAREDSSGYIMPNRDSRKEKIDPMAAMFMAFSELKFAERVAPQASFYETNTVEML